MARIIPRYPNYEIYIKNINGTDVHYVFADSYREAFDIALSLIRAMDMYELVSVSVSEVESFSVNISREEVE